MVRILVLVTPLLLLASCNAQRSSAAADRAALQRLRADIQFLAADELEGRGTPSRGLDVAAVYLESGLAAAGVEPAFSTTFRQGYSIGSYSPAKAQVVVSIDGRRVRPQDYVFFNFGHDPEKGPLRLPLVRVGNGIVDDEKNINDLANVDVEGKAAVALKGAPWPLDATAVFGPDRALGKLMAATARGAEMLVYLTNDLDTGEDAEARVYHEMRDVDVGFVRNQDLSYAPAVHPLLFLRATVMPQNAARIEIAVDAATQEKKAANVLGLVRGTDRTLRGEYIVVTAHYDHIGLHSLPKDQDGIWNGADDNASGTAAVLELARRIAREPGKRSVLLFFTSGEERGLLGSAVYGSRPVVPMEKVALQLNLDMIGRSHGQLQAIAPHSPALFKEAVAVARNHGITVVRDAQPSWRLINLTDTYYFARRNVPGLFFFTGIHSDYHQPSDTAERIRYDELARITSVAWQILRDYADGKQKPSFERPVWFGAP